MTVGEKAKNMHLKYNLCANKNFVKLRILSQKQLVLRKKVQINSWHISSLTYAKSDRLPEIKNFPLEC